MHAWWSMTTVLKLLVDGPPTWVRVSGSLLALLTYEYLGEYGLNTTFAYDGFDIALYRAKTMTLALKFFWEHTFITAVKINHTMFRHRQTDTLMYQLSYMTVEDI